MAQIQEQMEGLPGYDILMEYWDEYAGEHFNSMDPFEDKDGNQRKLPKQFSTAKEQKLWKQVQSKAWTHDRCFLGSCGVGLDCGLGLAPLVVLLFPVLGPLVMYAVHARLIHIVTNEINLPSKVVAKMQGQIVFDLIITFPPIIGCFLGYLHGCLTRNAGMIYKYFLFLAEQRQKNQHATYIGTGPIGHGDDGPNYQLNPYTNPEPPRTTTRNIFKRSPPPQNQIHIQPQQQSGFI